jgi:hypothetical protein
VLFGACLGIIALPDIVPIAESLYRKRKQSGVISSMQWAMLSYSTNNLGDDIQSLAIKRFLPKVDYLIDRDYLSEFTANEGMNTGIILNGWYGHRPENFPPPKGLIPLLTSIHLSKYPGNGPNPRPAATVMCEPPSSSYLKQYGPVGTRDPFTKDLLQRAGIDAFVSSCATLTFPRSSIARTSEIVCVDLPPDLVEEVRRKTTRPVTSLTHYVVPDTPTTERFDRAQSLLDKYAAVSAVVTTRLHVALPCLALGTPVYLLDWGDDRERFEGLHGLARHGTFQELLTGAKGFNIQRPTPNSTAFKDTARLLEVQIRAFVQYLVGHEGASADEVRLLAAEAAQRSRSAGARSRWQIGVRSILRRVQNEDKGE